MGCVVWYVKFEHEETDAIKSILRKPPFLGFTYIFVLLYMIYQEITHHTCPVCEHIVKVSIMPGTSPATCLPGHLNICMCCHNIARFGEDMRVELMAKADFLDLKNNPTQWNYMKSIIKRLLKREGIYPEIAASYSGDITKRINHLEA